MTDPFLLMMSEDDPHPRMHALREADPVHFVEPLGFWLLTRHADIKSMFNAPDLVTQDKRAWEFFIPAPEGSMLRWVEERGIFSVGPEEHDRLRRLVAAAFTPKAVQRMEGQIAAVVDETAENLRGRPGQLVDIRTDFTNVIPNRVVSRIAGVPPGDDEAHFCAIAQGVVQGSLPFTPEELREQAERGFVEFSAWVRAMVELRRGQPAEDLVTDLLRCQDADDTLTEDDIVLLLISLIGAGSEATSQVSTAIIRTLLGLPEVLERLREDRTLIRRSMAEILRYCFSVPAGTMRYAVSDFELGGKQIRKGQMLMLSSGGANRDPAVYGNPDVLDLDRQVNSPLTFGFGPHHCIGAHLAREEIAAMVDQLLDILPAGSQVDEDAIEYQDMGILLQAMTLPVRVAAGEAA